MLYKHVKITYPDIKIKKLDCVVRWQKWIGNGLGNLKKEKWLGGKGSLSDTTVGRL